MWHLGEENGWKLLVAQHDLPIFIPAEKPRYSNGPSIYVWDAASDKTLET